MLLITVNLLPLSLPAATKLWPRLCFYTCVWFCSRGGSPGRENPPGQGRTPPRQGDPPGRETPQAGRTPLGADTPSPGADPPRAAHSSIRSTSGRYASYWNAFLFTMFFIMSLITVNCDLLSLIIAWKAKLLYMNDIMNDKRPFPLHEQSWGNSFAKYSFDSLLIPTSG